MEPSTGFWDGMGASIGTSPGWMVLGVVLIIGVLFVVAKYIYPGHKEIKMRELDIRQREADNDADRIKSNAMMAETQRQTNVLIDGMRQSLDASTARVDVIVSEIHGSREGSRLMGEDVSHIKGTTDETNQLVKDIRRHVIGGEGTD